MFSRSFTLGEFQSYAGRQEARAFPPPISPRQPRRAKATFTCSSGVQVKVGRFPPAYGGEVLNIPWDKVLTAINLRDVAGLRLLAEEVRCGQRRQLLQVFAGIVENGHPNGASHREMLPRVAAQLVRNGAQQPIPAGVRGQQRTCRAVLYRADGYSIELRLEHEPGSRPRPHRPDREQQAT